MRRVTIFLAVYFMSSRGPKGAGFDNRVLLSGGFAGISIFRACTSPRRRPRVNTDLTGSWCINRLSYESTLVLAGITSYRQHNTLASLLFGRPFCERLTFRLSALSYCGDALYELRIRSFATKLRG